MRKIRLSTPQTHRKCFQPGIGCAAQPEVEIALALNQPINIQACGSQTLIKLA
jgi:hypothetical protein